MRRKEIKLKSNRNKINKQSKKKFTNKNGITLIALVITIIVLLILAGVTIAILTGDNGILIRANEAKEKTKETNAEEQVQLIIIGSIETDGKINLNKLNEGLKDIDNLTYNNYPITEDNQIENLPAVIEIDGNQIGITGNGECLEVSTIDEIKNSIYVEETTLVKDANNKNIILPKDFTIRIDESTTNADNVEEGIVIEDRGGNQYVWIPIDGILGENGKTLQNAVDGEIILGRYVFDNKGKIDRNLTPNVLAGELKTSTTALSYYVETSEGKRNAVAKDINKYIESVRNNRGYYIARFEASYDNKIESKYDKPVYRDLTQINAAKKCQDLYKEINSDLINSYAWDTAILFIQKYGQVDYSRQGSLNDFIQNTGLSGDLQCNIYDMASNGREWTTETYSNQYVSCVNRGGSPNTNDYASFRTGNSEALITGAFRLLLYL